MNQRFTLDRESFEQFLAAASLFQSLQQSDVNTPGPSNLPLLQYSLETLRAVDSGTMDLEAALQRVAGLALQTLDVEAAVAWLFTSDNLICRAAVGTQFDDDHVRTSLRLRLESAGAFGTNSPSTLDLTRTLANYSGTLGSSLAVALLPGTRIAGALAVFSDPSRTYTERNYANLRLLAGFAQYVLTKWVAGRERDELEQSPENNPGKSTLLPMQAASLMERSARAPLISGAPHSGRNEPGPAAHPDLPIVGTHAGVDVDPNRPEHATGPQSLLPVGDAGRTFREHIRKLRAHWGVISQAAPAFAILAVMSFFVGSLMGGRQPLALGSLNTVAQAAEEPLPHHSDIIGTQPVSASLVKKKSPATPVPTSHLQITDRATAATIAELSKYELQSLRRAADYGDDQAALELGFLYELGRGLPQSCTKAATWVTRAARNGNPAAEYNLGLRYRDGDGVSADIPQAETWLRKAAAHKNSNAARVLAELPPSGAAPQPKP